MSAPLLLVHVTPASYRDLPPRLNADELATMSISVSTTIALVRESLITLIEEAALRCVHLDGRGLIETTDHMLSDLAGEVGGAFSNAAEAELDEVYDGCPRGVMHRVRP